MTISLLVALVTAGACVRRPSEDRCAAMADHLVRLEAARHEGRAAELAAEVAGAHRDALIRTCLDEGTPTEVQCVLELEDLDGLSRCNPR